MANQNPFASAAVAHERDPREYPYGYLTGGTGLLEGVRVFVWFRTVDELIESLLEVEPRMYGVEPGRGLEAYQARVRPILERVRRSGLYPAARKQLAPETDGRFSVYWWGTYLDIRDGRDVLGCQLVEEFLGEERRGQLLRPDEEPAFIEFLSPRVAQAG
jgi:hypothetical protein